MKVFITGISGYIGSALTEKLLENNKINSITGTDVKEPQFDTSRLKFIKCDIRSPELADAMNGCDTAVHLAFIVQEIRNKKLIYDINVNGTKNFLNACRENRVRKIVVASSIAAYGSVKRDGIITEDTPIEGNRSSYYSNTKKIVEHMLDEFLKENNNVIVTRLRPSVLIGKNINNSFREIVNMPVIYHIKGNDSIPVVYEKDVAEAFLKAIIEDRPGAFNIHAGNLSLDWVAKTLGVRKKAINFHVAKFIVNAAYLLGLSAVSGHWIELSRYPFEISAEKAKRELGWRTTKSPEEAFLELLNHTKGGNL
jgi:nucleoside-diphosphate-sugar epimerase